MQKKATVDFLVLGHYSTRYQNIEMFQKEAKIMFENVLLADDGVQFEMKITNEKIDFYKINKL